MIDRRCGSLLPLIALALTACSPDRTPPPPDVPVATDHRLVVNLAGAGQGRVRSTPAGIDCAASCEASFADGTRIELRTEPVPGSSFAGWSGACTGTAPCVLLVDRALTLTARFEPLPPEAPVGLWLLGDLHVHDDHSSDGSAPRQLADDQGPGNVAIVDQLGFAEALGLDFLPLTDHRTYDQHYDPTWESASLLLIPGEEANGSPHATVHGGVDTVVQGSGGGDELRRLQQSIWDAHSQGAVWVTAHPDDGEVDEDGRPNARAAAVGVDLVETWNRASNVEREIDYAEERWTAGYRFGIAGASDSHFRELWAFAGPGLPTTRVFAAAATERGLLEGLRTGRTQLSSDPLGPEVRLSADMQGDGVFEALGGDEVFVPAGTAFTLRVEVDRPLGATVQVYANPGRSAGPIASYAPTLVELAAVYELPLIAPATAAWYRVELRGLGQPQTYDTSDVPVSILPMPQDLPDQLRAMSAPIFVSATPAVPSGAALLPADRGIDDGSEPAFATPGLFHGFADLASTDGVSHLVGERHRGSETEIVYRRRGSDGAWGDARVLSASGLARFPKIAARGAAIWVAWQDEAQGQRPRRPAIHLRHSGDGGTTWGAVQVLRDGDRRAEHPALALTAAGDPVVAWQEIRPAEPFDVFVQVLGRDAAPVNVSRRGKVFAAAAAVDSRSARYPASVWPSLAVAADGRITVAWQDNRDDIDPLWTGQAGVGEGSDPDDWQIRLRTRAGDAADWGEPRTLGASDRADRHPALAYGAGDRLVVAWDSKPLSSSGVDLVVLAAQEQADGRFGDAAAIAPGSVGMGQHPRLGRDATGAVRAVWTDGRSDDWRWRILCVRLEDGQWRDAQLIPSRGNNTWPATDGSGLVFASTRSAQRLQRDPSQQIQWRALP